MKMKYYFLIFIIATVLVKSELLYSQDSSDVIVKNYIGLNSSVFLNEDSRFGVSNQNYIFGTGYLFGLHYQRRIWGNNFGSLHLTANADNLFVNYNGWIANNGVKENFIANERYLLLSAGALLSLYEKKSRFDHFDLEMSFTYWMLTDQKYSFHTNNTLDFPSADSRLSFVFYPHYTRRFDKMKFSIGPFINTDLAQFGKKGEVFDLIITGFKIKLSSGF